MNNFVLNTILSCPVCGGMLNFTDESQITRENQEKVEQIEESRYFGLPVCLDCKIEYSLRNSIPILLPKSSQKEEMRYIEHYTKDAEFFDYFEENESKPSEHEEKRLRQFILSKISDDDKTILDVGSGGAWLANSIDFDKHNLISFDISERNVSRALSEHSNSKHFGVVGDCLNPPFRENSIDCIVASEIIEHLVEPQEFVRQMNRILKPGGTLIISTPYKEKLQYYLCIHCNEMTPKNAHLHSFDEKKLNSYFTQDKFVSVESIELEKTGEKHVEENPTVEGVKYFIFGNKALIVLRTHVFLKFLPFSLWKVVDKIANMILNKPAHIIVVYRKKK